MNIGGAGTWVPPLLEPWPPVEDQPPLELLLLDAELEAELALLALEVLVLPPKLLLLEPLLPLEALLADEALLPELPLEP
jgi:hypothetical protein